MFEIKAGNETIKVSSRRVARMADRLWRLPQAQRDNALDRARARLSGDYPSARDAAIVALAGE